MDVILDARCGMVPDKSKPLVSSHDPYHQLLMTYGYVERDAPVGDFLKHVQGFSGRWLVASPLYWQATHNDAMVVAAGPALAITDEASRALCEMYAAFLLEERVVLRYHNRYTWLIQTDESINTTALHGLLNRSIRPFLDALKSTPYWLRLITESQLFLHAHAEQKGLKVNGLWIWGEGELKQKQGRPLVVWADDPSYEKACGYLSSQVRRFLRDDVFQKETIIFVPEQATERAVELEARLKNSRIHWYWADQAYETEPLSWFRRLWR
ncbi:MAG: hypothetical protein ACOYKA_01650 [Legionellaceae bacterium]